MGWWVGRGEGDAKGHLLRVTAGYSRMVGQAYLPKDIAEIKVCVMRMCSTLGIWQQSSAGIH